MGKQTTSDKRIHQDGKTSWNQYDGTKKSRDVQVTQMNQKTDEGAHYYYNPKQGRSGVALENAPRKERK